MDKNEQIITPPEINQEGGQDLTTGDMRKQMWSLAWPMMEINDTRLLASAIG